MKIPMIVVLLVAVSVVTLHSREYTAVLLPKNDVELAFPLDGVLWKVLIEEGDEVRTGQLLMKLDDRVQSLEAKKRKIQMEDESKLISAKLELQILKERLEATKKLFDKTGSVSEDELRTLEIRTANSQANYDSQLVMEKRERVEYEGASEVLAQHQLLSPLNGKVVEIRGEKGEWFRTGTPMVRLINDFICTIEFHVSQTDSTRFQVGDKLKVMQNLNGQLSEGIASIKFISPIADGASGLVKIKAEFVNQDGKFLTGSTVTIAQEK